jgi:hypothetical protein
MPPTGILRVVLIGTPVLAFGRTVAKVRPNVINLLSMRGNAVSTCGFSTWILGQAQNDGLLNASC